MVLFIKMQVIIHEIGICGQTRHLQSNRDGIVDRLAFITNGGNLRTGSSSTTSITGGSAQTGAGWIRIACDMDNKKIWFSDTSGNYFNSGNPATGANAAYDFSSHEVADGWTPYVFMGTGGVITANVNFGQFDLNSFSSNIPAGFKTLTSENLPDPTYCYLTNILILFFIQVMIQMHRQYNWCWVSA